MNKQTNKKKEEYKLEKLLDAISFLYLKANINLLTLKKKKKKKKKFCWGINPQEPASS